MRFKKTRKIISTVISTLLIITLLSVTLLVISTKASGGEPEINGYQLKTVLSGSMEPTFQTGSVILVKKLDDTTNLKKGDVITFKQDENRVVTHRIADVVEKESGTLYQTKGDNNEHADTNLVLSENVVAKYTGFTIPFVGYVVNFASSPIGTALLLVLPGIVLIGYAFFTIRSGIKELENKTKAVAVESEK